MTQQPISQQITLIADDLLNLENQLQAALQVLGMELAQVRRNGTVLRQIAARLSRADNADADP